MTAGFFVFAMCLTGCGINPRKVTDIPSSRDFSALDCSALAGEKKRIEDSYVPLRFASKHGTERKIAILNGEASAVTDQIHTKDCKIAAVRIPGDPWPEVENDKGSSR